MFEKLRGRNEPTASSLQGTVIMANIDSTLFDPEYWETPYQFNPGHFLDKNGNFVTREAFLAFSAGRFADNWNRLCGLDCEREAVLFFLWERPKGVESHNRSTWFSQAKKKNVWLENNLFGNYINCWP